MSVNYQIMEKEPVRVLTLFLCNGTKKHGEPRREIGYHLKNHFSVFVFCFVFNHIIILNSNDKIMEKEPVRVLTPFQCDGTKNTGNHWKKEDTIYLFIFSFLFFPFSPPPFFFFFNKIIIFNLNDKIMEKEPWGCWHHFNAMEPKNTGNHKEKEGII